MPVAEFSGGSGWGYDGVELFAPTHLYGRPDDFRGFVDKAHSLGMGVILDVVYNHLGAAAIICRNSPMTTLLIVIRRTGEPRSILTVTAPMLLEILSFPMRTTGLKNSTSTVCDSI